MKARLAAGLPTIGRVKTLRTALLLTAALALASCGDEDDDKGDAGKPAAQKPSVVGAELVRDIEQYIVRGAKKEDRQAGNDPADYEYRIECAAKSDARVDCTLDLLGDGADPVNEIVYRVDVTPGTEQYDYRVISNRDTRKKN